MLALGVVLQFLIACAGLPAKQVHVWFAFTHGDWKLGHLAEVKGKYAIAEFTRSGDDINLWQDRLTNRHSRQPGWSPPEDLPENLRALRQQGRPVVTTCIVSAGDEKSISACGRRSQGLSGKTSTRSPESFLVDTACSSCTMCTRRCASRSSNVNNGRGVFRGLPVAAP